MDRPSASIDRLEAEDWCAIYEADGEKDRDITALLNWAAELEERIESMKGDMSALKLLRDSLADRERLLVREGQKMARNMLCLKQALEKAQAAMWDAHYGKGISVEYAQEVDREVCLVLRGFAGDNE